MFTSLPDDLAKAVALLRARRLGEARALLSERLRRDPRSDQAWYLLSLAVEDPRQQRDCLQRALQLNPGHALAQERLAAVEAALAAAPRPVDPPATRPAPEPTTTAPSGPAPAKRPPSAVHPAARTERQAELPPPAPVIADPLPSPPAKAARRGPSSARWLLLGLGGLAAACSAAVAGLYAAGFFAEPTPMTVVVQAATPLTYPTLPPTWTASPEPTETPVPSATPTRTPTAAPTLPPPDATMAADMDEIALQVADLRGLDIQGTNPRYLVARGRVEEVLTGLVLSPDLHAELEDQQVVLSVLGLIKPTYDLVKYALNSHADNIGGFYLPWTKAMYVIGSEFGGIERFIYSHEYTHALTDAHFNVEAMGVYPVCVEDAQRCAAVRALVEGDATLLMEQWWQQYATPQDYLDIAEYEPPAYTLPEEFPPPYITADLAFPYNSGYEFVAYLHERGNWAAVNRAYADLPQSTEHILHPEKYLADEAPVAVTLPAQPALAEGWRLVDEDVLGEWLTYLILGYGADLSAQLAPAEALEAAAGWGGDRYQVYYEAATGATVLAARWTWDTPRDADQFARAMHTYQDQRFRGAAVARADGDCWEANGQASCLFTHDGESLWLLAPDQTVLNNVLLAFPDF